MEPTWGGGGKREMAEVGGEFACTYLWVEAISRFSTAHPLLAN